MGTRVAVIVTLDVEERRPEFEQTMLKVIESLRDHFGSLFTEHRPTISMTFDEVDMDLLDAVERRILRRQGDG